MKEVAPRGASAAGRGARDRIFHGDCIEGMAAMKESSVDLIVTDPPFAIGFGARRANYNRKEGNVMDGYNEITPAEYPGFTGRWMAGAHRVLKETGSMFVFSGWTNLQDILRAIDETGFKTINHIIWRYQFGVYTKRRFVSSHYHCLYVCKNDKKRRFYTESRHSDTKSRYRDMEDVWVINREYWSGKKKTPTKLPGELIRKILQYSSREGDLVMDPFLGSGQVAVVSKEMGRRYAGFEIVREYYDFALERLGARGRAKGAGPAP
ncbi:DNA modification methylase [Cenarchaeum symbiosum A]|uniref:Type II methyltransferase n=1 Tax=Cenarchaeum symbiosum (strain A) TaxID=414004 RepID=A0RXC4_CENSY|nr:DNA modification methylase [Cenarchaeum symbiosum A]